MGTEYDRQDLPYPPIQQVIERIDRRRAVETDPAERLYLIGCREHYLKRLREENIKAKEEDCIES